MAQPGRHHNHLMLDESMGTLELLFYSFKTHNTA
jgi:hypothetical protein